jgi:hypothetical protein
MEEEFVLFPFPLVSPLSLFSFNIRTFVRYVGIEDRIWIEEKQVVCLIPVQQ